VEVNGVPATFLLDTGTTHTVVSKEFADQIGMHGDTFKRDVPIEVNALGARQAGDVADLKSLRVGPVRAKRKPGQVLIVDLPQLGAHFGKDVDGILGNATWSSADFVLDAGRPSLGISRRLELARSTEAHRLRASSNMTYLPVEIDGRSFEFLLDTGSSATRVTQQLIDELRPVNYDYVELEITTMGSKEYRKFPALHAAVQVGQVRIPQFTFLVGKENVIGLNLLRYGELSVSVREGMFIFREREAP
jgi:predicted aspartyl protease